MKRRSPAKLARLLRVVRFQKEAQEVELARQRGRANEARSEIERLYSAADASEGLSTAFHDLYQRRIASLSTIRTQSEAAAERAAAALGTQTERVKRVEAQHRRAAAELSRHRAERELLELIERSGGGAAPASRKTGGLE